MRNKIKSTLLLFFFVITIDQCYSSENDEDDLLAQIKSQKLSSHRYWYKLLHYKKNKQSINDTVTSDIITPSFFLSAVGATDPESEIKATLKALLAPLGKNPDSHAQCKFRARYFWLRKKLNWNNITAPVISCLSYEKWGRNNKIDSLSLVFATGYLSNPASYYGHILLKFNSLDTNFLLDESLNYGANITENENALVYIFKGLFGGYQSGFSAKKFYTLNHSYTENEFRDLWEYKLNLSNDELQQIIAHSWELLGVENVYYFLKENCAFRMAELLGLVIDEPLLPNYFWSNPVTVFDRLVKIKRNNIPLVQQISRVASRQNNFYDKYFNLSEKNKFELEYNVNNNGEWRDSYLLLNNQDKIEITNTLIDYYEYLIINDKENTDLKARKQAILYQRSLLPIVDDVIRNDKISSLSAPHNGPLPMMLRVAMQQNSIYNNSLQIQFRPVSYDLLAIDKARIANSSLTMFDIKAQYFNDNLLLQNIDLINVETLNVSKTQLPGDSDFAWNFKLSVERNDLACQDCLVSKVTGGLGKAYSFSQSNSIIVYGILDSFIQSNYKDSGTVALAPRVAMIISYSNWFKSNLYISRNWFIDNSDLDESRIKWQTRLGAQRDWDIRINYEQYRANEFSVALSKYW